MVFVLSVIFLSACTSVDETKKEEKEEVLAKTEYLLKREYIGEASEYDSYYIVYKYNTITRTLYKANLFIGASRGGTGADTIVRENISLKESKEILGMN